MTAAPDWQTIAAYDDVCGWAVLTGCEGDDPTLHALFVGKHAQADAQRYVDTYRDEDGEPLFDPCVAPWRGKALVGFGDPNDDQIAIDEMFRIVPGWERRKAGA